MKFEYRYSALDRLLHNIAFSSLNLQKALADIEDRIFAGRIEDVSIDSPVFITSLPRAGTTLLLEVVSALDGFVTHTYREMPFLLLPIFWNMISCRFRTYEGIQERAHGDGMTVGYDSVEAFEEIIWRAFWPEKYRKDSILPWETDDKDRYGEFEHFMKNHIRKLIALHRAEGHRSMRYVSKNNANISRIAVINRLFPDAIILIPFRNPVDHVGSMLRQHYNFKEIHAHNDFALKYMKDIGHFDFGENFRPIDFTDWLQESNINGKDTANFWMRYWCETFDYILSRTTDNMVFVSYDNCCSMPVDALQKIGSSIGHVYCEELTAHAYRFHAPMNHNLDDFIIDQSLHERADYIYTKLNEASII